MAGSSSTHLPRRRSASPASSAVNGELRDEDIPRLRRQMEAVCVIAAPPFEDEDVPPLTRDPKDDPILWSALAGGADLLISNDKDLVPDKQEELWEHETGTVLALTFETLLADRLSGIEWNEIDGSWLALAYEQPS